MSSAKKIIKEMKYMGFGFPIVLKSVPAKYIRGQLEPVFSHKELGFQVLELLCLKKKSLTGNQVKFIRLFFDFSLRDFASLLGVTHQAVMKWENFADEYATISESTEKIIRLNVLYRLNKKPKVFLQDFAHVIDLTIEAKHGIEDLHLKLVC